MAHKDVWKEGVAALTQATCRCLLADAGNPALMKKRQHMCQLCAELPGAGVRSDTDCEMRGGICGAAMAAAALRIHAAHCRPRKRG